MVDIHLYGKLRRYAGNYKPGQDCVVTLETGPGDTMAAILQRVGIPAAEINHIFFNARLLATGNALAAFYGYPQARPNLDGWDDFPVADGDRIGIFGHDMAVLSM